MLRYDEMPTRAGKFVSLVALAAALILATGCTVSGHPVPDQPDVGSLEVGGYSRVPLDAPSVHNEKYGRVVESVRLGEAVVDPVEVDPALSFDLNGYSAVPLPTAGKAIAFLANPVRSVLERRGLLAGFAVGGVDRNVGRQPAVGAVRLLTLMVLRFPDPTAAQQAAQEIDSVDAAISPENVSAAVPGYPAAHGHWRPNVPTLAASIAQDSFVVTLLAGHTAPDLGILTGLARKAFDAQLPKIRDFAVTPPDQLATLPLDRDGMLARMVPKAPGRWPFPVVYFSTEQDNAGWDTGVMASGVVYGPHATQLFRGRDKPNPPELSAFNGLEFLARYPNVAAARQSFTQAKPGDIQDSVGGMSSLTGVPDTSCGEQIDVRVGASMRYFCRVLYGRYIATLFGRTLPDFQQRAAAQYALLVNSEPEP